ncbi:Na+ dependent nucleoside transporter N-terminal domain-containing protein [Metabacillus niabensis]
MNLLWGIFGILVVLALALLLSNNKKAIRIRTILGGLVIQLVFAF